MCVSARRFSVAKANGAANSGRRIIEKTSQAKSARRGPPEGWVYRAYTSIRLVRHILIYNMSEVVGFYVKNL